MAAEGKLLELKQGLSTGIQSASLANVVEQDKASENECKLTGASSSISSLNNANSSINNDIHQVPIAEPGHDRTNSKLCDDRCIPARDASETSSKGMQSNNDESHACHTTGYNSYATRSSVGVDKKCIGSNPNVSVAASTASLRSRHSNSANMAGIFDARVPLHSKSFPSTPSSSFSKYPLHSQHLKSSSKVPQLGTNYLSDLFRKTTFSARSSSSPSNQAQRLFLNGASSYRPNGLTIGGYDEYKVGYRPNGQTVGGYDGYKIGERSTRSSIFEDQKESSRGPRSRRVQSLLNLQNEKEQLGARVRRDRYNRSDFPITHDNAKFFIIKSYSEEDIHKSIKYDVWSSTPNGNRKLNEAYLDAETRYTEKGTRCPIFLFFSVNGSGQFLGLAEMIGPVDFEKDLDFWQQDKWSGFFPVRWHIVKDIPNSKLRHIILEYNDNKPVTYTRDTQEVRLKQGLEMLSIFKNFSSVTSMLDDYKYYEEQDQSLQIRKSRKAESTEYDIYRNDFSVRNMAAGPRNGEHASVRTRDVSMSVSDTYASLAALARNLSLNQRHKC